MKKSKRYQSLSGAVLIMILAVMFILIILLAATLTTVSTANKRILTKYEENQAYYTVRSALDVFALSMLSDATYTSNVNYTYTKADGNNATVAMSQGRSLNMEMYRLKAQKGPYNVTQSELRTESGAAGKKQYEDWFGTDSSKVKTDANGNEYLEYEVEFPKVSDDSHEYGNMADDLKIKIKVEVLERIYDIGDYNIGSYSDKASFFENANGSEKAKAVMSGNRKKDFMRYKITGTSTVGGVDGIAAFIYDTIKPPTIDGGDWEDALKTPDLEHTNHLNILNGMTIKGPYGSVVEVRNEGAIYGKVYCEAGLKFNVNTKITFANNDYMFVGGDLDANNNVTFKGNASAGASKSERPFIYVGGAVIAPNFERVGGNSDSEKVDMVVHGITWTGNKFIVNGDIYSDGDCNFDSTAATPDITGDLYVKGNLKVGGNVASIDGDSGKLMLNFGACNIHLTGDVMYNGVAYPLTSVINNGGTITQEPSIASNMTIPPVTAITDTTAAETSVEVKLPNSVVKKLDTHKAKFNAFYRTDESGNYIDEEGNIVSEPQYKSAVERSQVDFTQDSFITGLTTLKDAGTDIEVSAGATNRYLLSSSCNNNTYRITGSGTVELVMAIEPNPWYMPTECNLQNITIIVDDSVSVVVYGGNKDTKYRLDKVAIWTTMTWNAYTSGAPIYGGTEDADVLVPPRISYYFSGGEVSLENSASFLTGYFYGPTTKLTANAQSNIKFANPYYNKKPIDASLEWSVAGAVISGQTNFQNNHGIFFIGSPDESFDDENADPAAPIHSWLPSMSVRS